MDITNKLIFYSGKAVFTLCGAGTYLLICTGNVLYNIYIFMAN